jgi:repressor LexA
MGRKPLLTPQRVLATIQRALVERGTPPSLEELRRDLHVGSTRTVLRYLDTLEQQGAIGRGDGARSIRLLKSSRSGVETRAVPLVGDVPAGPAMIAEENIEGWIRVPKALASPSTDRFFLLHVRGNSMNKASISGDLIEDGDLVLVRQRVTAQSGDIVVALVDGEATVKRFTAAPGYYVLKPQSSEPTHQPIIVGDDFRVLGTVTRVLKKGSDVLREVITEEGS